MKEKRTRTVTIRMTPEDNEIIEKYAKATYRTKSELITYCTIQYIGSVIERRMLEETSSIRLNS